MDAGLDRFARRHLGARVAEREFFEESVGRVHGLRLDDGRRVVVKAYRPGTSAGFLEAVRAIKGRLAAAGFPRARAARRAAGLARLVASAGPPADFPGLHEHPMAMGAPWRVPHDPRFDFEHTAAGAEWIDRIAAAAKPVREAAGELVVGHTDWRADHLRFEGDAGGPPGSARAFLAAHADELLT